MLTIGKPMPTTPLTNPPSRTAKAMIANRKGSCPNIPRLSSQSAGLAADGR
jgi:hypothetical protein